MSGKAPEESTVTDPTDIVLVMDRSLSMEDKATWHDRYDKMTQAKNAAKQFARKMLESDKVRIAVVMYTKTAQTVKGQNQDAFSNTYATVENRINSITTKGVPSENSGTNTQAGIHAARELLKASTAKNKIMIVLSDGQPNYSFRFTGTADYVGCTQRSCGDWFPIHGRVYPSGGRLENIKVEANYSDIVANEGSFNLSDGNAKLNVKCVKHNWTYEDYGVYDGSTYNGDKLETDHSVATIWEAGQAENEGVEIYSIGFGIGNNQNAIQTMKGIASAKTEDHYFSAGVSANDIEAVFNSIAKRVSKYVAYNPIVIDTISNDFEYYKDSTLTASAGEGDTITPDGQTVTWDLAAKQLDTTKHTLTFYVKYKHLDEKVPAPDALLPTNNGALLKYAKEENGQPTETQNIANASVPSLSKTVSYTVTGTEPKGYTKPGDAYVWVGHDYTVADVPETVNAKEGTYTFEGWKANRETVSGKLEISSDITLTGEWTFKAAPTTKTLTITKNWEGTTEKPAVTFLLTQKKNNVPTNYTKTFVLDGEVDTGSEAVETAAWTATIEVPVKDDDNTEFEYSVKETKIGDISVTIPAGDVYVTASNPDGSDYNVGKWTIGFTDYQDNTYLFTNTYTEAKHDYEVAYEFVGTDKPADVTVPSKVEGLYEGQKIALAQVSTAETGWTFNGWYSTADCGEGDKVGDPGSTYEVKGSATLYGEWSYQAPEPETATLSFVFKSGTEDKNLPDSVMPTAPSNVTKEVGAAVPLTNYTETVNDDENNGTWTFEGWYTDDNLSAESKITGDTYPMPEGGGKLYGKWTFTDNTPEPQPDLSVEKKAYLVGEGKETTEITSTTKVRPGDTIQYVITIKNTGNVDLENITLTDTFGGTGTLYEDMGKTMPVVLDSNKEFTVNVGTLDVGASKPYTYYYWVQDEDGTRITNAAVARAKDDTEDSTEITTPVDRGDVDGYEVSGWIEKIVESKKGSFKKDASFTFDIWADEACTDRLSTVTISKEWDVLKDQYDEKAESFSFKISENDFEKLNTIDRCKVIYVTEREGSIKGMSYDSGVVTMYLVQIEAAAYSLHIGENDHYYATADLSYNNPHPAEFTNVYKKPADKGETIKSGPQLNRDDHVAYIMGYPDGTVQPEGEITRAEACTIFFRLLTDSSRDYYFARTNDYSDVNAGDWFNNAISTLSNAGIVTGYNDGTFRPNQPITRGEMAKIIANFANLKYGGKTFTDLAGHWSKSYVELAAGNGWIAGYPDGSFRPDQKITRAETVTMINRVLDRVPAKESRLLSRSIMLTFPDNKPGDWYYIAIQEASNSHEYRRSVYETTGDEMWTKLIDNVDWTKLEK